MGPIDTPGRPDGMSEVEWRVRLDLAACYQLFDYLDWTSGIFNHISARVPGPDRLYLMNPYGLHYAEVTASNLIKVDVHGNVVGESRYPGNPAGFAIHGAIHAARDDLHCVIHTHTVAGMAIAQKAGGLRHDDFNGAILHGAVAYHDFEGITVRPEEGARLVRSLGERNVMILRNHGLLAAGKDIPTAFLVYYNLENACRTQLAADALRGPDIALPPEILAQVARDRAAFDRSGQTARLLFDGMVRRMAMARSGRYVDWWS